MSATERSKAKPFAIHQRVLKRVIDDASAWRGAQHPDEFPEFDAYIRLARNALKELVAAAREAKT